MTEVPDITVIIPTFQREEVLVDTIHSILKQTYKNFELIVVDQTEKHLPATIAALESIQDKRLRLFKVKPASVTAAKNFAIKKATAPVALTIDDDILPNKNLIKFHLLAYHNNPGISAVAGRVVQDGFPTIDDVLRFDQYGISHGGFTSMKPGYTNAFPGGNCSIKISDALKVGGFDTRYYANSFREENDMSLKMARAKMKIYFEPKAEVFHLATPSGGSRSKKYTELYDTPMFYRNELFFTLRVVKRGNWVEALRRKYREYCLVVRHGRAYKRRVLFFLGLIAAIWRLSFGRQVIAKEVI